MFTGDALLIRGCGRCDFQQGNAGTLYDSISSQIFSLPDSCLVYPGHDYNGRTISSVAEEKAYNARIGGGASKQDFVGYMDAMQLPHPKQIDIALSANMVSGEPEDGKMPAEPDWAPVVVTFAGVMDIPGNVLAGNWRAMVYIDDKSSPEQEAALLALYTGKLGGPVADLVKLIGEVVGVERVPITFNLA